MQENNRLTSGMGRSWTMIKSRRLITAIHRPTMMAADRVPPSQSQKITLDSHRETRYQRTKAWKHACMEASKASSSSSSSTYVAISSVSQRKTVSPAKNRQDHRKMLGRTTGRTVSTRAAVAPCHVMSCIPSCHVMMSWQVPLGLPKPQRSVTTRQRKP